jgi:hypothetical protein
MPQNVEIEPCTLVLVDYYGIDSTRLAEQGMG